MIKQRAIFDDNFNIIEFIEEDSDGNVLSTEILSYHDNGQIKRKECSNGQITEWNEEGVVTFMDGYTTWDSIGVSWMTSTADLCIQLDETRIALEEFNSALKHLNERLMDIVCIPKQYFNDT